MSKKKLKPVDLERCQAEKLEGSFMTFGPRSMIRCNNNPTWVAIERRSNKEDGLVGSMSLCDVCKDMLIKKLGSKFAKFEKVGVWAKQQ